MHPVGALPIPTPLEGVAHVIQLALTPVFLLSGIATLLNVFSQRFARIADQVAKAREDLTIAEGDERSRLRGRLIELGHRSFALEIAVITAAAGGVATAMTALTLFLGGTARVFDAAALLMLSFGAAVVFTVLALAAFLVEMLMASRSVRVEARRVRQL